jgi:hypothetical protein
MKVGVGGAERAPPTALDHVDPAAVDARQRLLDGGAGEPAS